MDRAPANAGGGAATCHDTRRRQPTVAPFKPIYAYFGYDEPNYTYMKNGRKLVGELARLSAVPVYIRTHFMLAPATARPA